MASDNEAFCVSDPNFAVICSFLECFGKSCGIDYPDIATLQKMLEDTHEVPQPLVDLHIKLLRKTRKSVSSEKWERALVKFCHTYSNQDGWELERFGYKKARIGVKLRLLKVLLESQFDLNQKFKNEVNKLAAKELRVEPLGRDKTGLSYWFQLDEGCNIRVYREDLDEESWELVANDREGVANLINTLSDGEIGAIPINEDSNSLEISEKPIIDTGQVSTSSPSLDDDGGGGSAQENGDTSDSKNQIQLNNENVNHDVVEKPLHKKISKKIVDESDNSDGGSEDEEQEEDEDEDAEDEDEDEDGLSNEEEEISKHTEEDEEDEDEDEEEEDEDTDGDDERTVEVTAAAVAMVPKVPVNQLKKQIKDGDYAKRKTVVAYESDNVEREIAKTSVIKPIIQEPTPIKSIETPVITTSPLKLVNIAELKHTTNDRLSDMTIPTPVSMIKSAPIEDSISSTIKMHEKVPSKNSLPFNDPIVSHSKFPIKPIDQLAANLVRMQSEKLEKPSASKLLEKIAENLARSSGAHGSAIINGDDEKFLPDFSARNQSEKLNLIGNVRNSRGIDLSTSPRGWEGANDHDRPVDFSGIDLSSRKTTAKPADLPSPGYRPQEFQYREMDLSTRKVAKSELPNLPYDSRTAMLRNHTMVTDLSKRPMPFVNYDMPSVAAAAYHGGARIPGKDEHRLANYTILPDPSKLASMRSVGVKRTLESVEDPQQEMLKRIRADLMRGAIDKKSTMVGGMRRHDVGPAIEEPIMMVHGEGSGSDCDAGNPEVGESIEEPVIFFYGEGNGRDCDTGNPGDETPTDNKDSNESKDEGCSQITDTLSQSEVTEDKDTDTQENEQLEISSNAANAVVKSMQINSDSSDDNTTLTTAINCQLSDIATTSECAKMKFKPSLGVQVIPKTSSGPPIKRFSRWDVGAPEEKRECDSSIISNEENISMESSSNYAQSGSEEKTSNSTPNLQSTESKSGSDTITSTTNQTSSQTASTLMLLPGDNLTSTHNEIQCDSSSVEPIEVESTQQEKVSESTGEIKTSETSHRDETDDAPRFFFGPNCVSYTPATIGKGSLEPDATSSSSIIHAPEFGADENTCTTDNNSNLMKDSDVPTVVSGLVLAEADDGSSERVNCEDENPTESVPPTTENMEVSIDEEPSDGEDKEEVSSDLERRMDENEVEKENVSEIKDYNEDQPTTTVGNEVPELSNFASKHAEQKQDEDESTITPTTSDDKTYDDTVTNSECNEIGKSETKTPGVTTVVESTSLMNEVCSTSTMDDKIEDGACTTIVGMIDSSSVAEEVKIKSVEISNVGSEENKTKTASENTTSQSIVGEMTAEVENINIGSTETEQEQTVESSVEDAPSHIATDQDPVTIHNIDEKHQSCDTSASEPICESIPIQDCTAEAAPFAVADSSDLKSERTKALSEEESENEESRKIVDSTDTFCDDFSDNQSSSVDQDSNEPMVIDDRTSDSSESIKNSSTQEGEQFDDSPSKIPDSNASETNEIVDESTSEVTIERSNPTCVIITPNSDSPEYSQPEKKSDTVCEQPISGEKEGKMTEDITQPIDKESRSSVSPMNEEFNESSEPPLVDGSMSSEECSKPSLISQTSLVANYDSNESNDTAIGDVIVNESGMEADPRDVEEPMITDSSQKSQVSVEGPDKIEVTEPEPETSVENTSCIDTITVETTQPDEIKKKEDNDIFEKGEDTSGNPVDETVKVSVNEEKSIVKSMESVDETLVEKMVVTQINKDPCDANEVGKIAEKENQETKDDSEQPATEVIGRVVPETPETEPSKLEISEPPQNPEQAKSLLVNSPQKIAETEGINRTNLENIPKKITEDTGAFGSEYSRSNSPAYTDEDEDDGEPPIVQVSKRARTDTVEFDQKVFDKPTCINAISKEKPLLNESQYACGYNVPTSIVAPMAKSDDYLRTLQIGENPEIDMLDNTPRVPFVKENIEAKVEESGCENSPSMSMKKSFEELNPRLNLNVMTTITESVQQDKNRESSIYTKSDVKKEACKQIHHTIESEDLQLLESKPINADFLKDEPQKINDIKSISHEKHIEVIDKTLKSPIQSIIAITPPVPQLVEKKEFEVKSEEVSLVCSNNLSDTKQGECELIQDNTIVITDLSNAKPVEEHGDYSDDSMGVDNECIFDSTENNVDPLLIANDDLPEEKMDLESAETKLGVRVKAMNEIQYEGWKLDSTEPMTLTPKISRKRRNSTHESNSEDCVAKQGDELDEMTGGKRMKLRGKRTPDMTLRKSVEDSRVMGGSSEDEAPAVAESIPLASPNPPSPIDEVKENDETTIVHQYKPKSKAKGGRKRRGFRSKRRASRHKKPDTTSPVAGAPILNADSTPLDDASESTPTARKKRKKRKMVLGLEIGIDIALPDSQSAGGALDETPVRQSRRIAQIKIKEQADRRRIEEEALGEMKEKKDRDSTDKKKRKKIKNESDDDPPVKLEVREEKEVKSKKKRKKRRKEAKFNEAKPWQSSSGSSTEVEDHNDEDLDDEDDIESEESLLFKSDHEFSPESDLEKDAETEPMRRARTAQKLQNDIEEAEDEYACQKCGKADHPEWILLCDTCDKGWHCSCLRPALMLIPEGDWFCPPCQHTLLVNKLRESLKTYDQLAKRHENEILRKKRLAFVGISLDNVLQKNDAHRHHRSSRLSSQDGDDSDEDNDGDDDDDAASNGGSSSSSESSDSGSSESGSSSDESEPVYQLRERRCANTYKFNEYDDMINAAIQDEVEAVQGAGNQGRGKDISTIVNAEKDETQVETFDKQMEEEIDEEKKSEKESDKELSKDADITDNEEQHKSLSGKRLISRKKHRKLNSLDISSEDDPDSDEDFKGSSSDEDEDYEDQLLSSDDDSFTESRRRGKKNSRPVRRSTRAARKTRYDEDFINDDSDDSDRPKRKKSKSTWDESESEESDNSWRSRKKRSRPSAVPRLRASAKSKSKKKKKRKRIIEPDNQSDNENEEGEVMAETTKDNIEEKMKAAVVETPQESESVEEPVGDVVPIVDQPIPIAELPEPASDYNERNKISINEEIEEDKQDKDYHEISPVAESKSEYTSHHPLPTPVFAEGEIEKRKERTPRQKKTPTMRRKIIYGGLPDDGPQREEEPLGRRTRGRKINYQVDTIMSDSEEELKKALRKTEESEDEFVVHEGEDVHDEVDKDSDSGDIYSPKKDAPKGRYKSPKNRRTKRSPGGKSMTDNGEPKQRKKPGPKPGSKNKPRQPKNMMSSLEGGVIGDMAEGSLASLGTGELAELDDEQLEQMMMEDEEYGRRQLELAAIEIAKNKKKEEREAKKLEKARLKALEILAAEQQRDPNAPEGTDGEAPKKKKRGRRSKAEILADQMRRDGAPHLSGNLTPSPSIPTIVSPPLTLVNPALPTLPVIMMPSDPIERPPPAEGQMPMISGPEGHLFNPDGTPMKPKRRGRGKGKKTLALEAARAAEAAAKAAAEAGGLGLTGAEVNSDLKHDDIPNVLPTPGSSTSGSAPSTPPAIAVTSQGLPPPSQSSNPQSVYPQLPPSQQSSVITRMLQSQPVSTAPQSFTAAAAAMGQKYFGLPNTASQMMGGPRPTYDMSPRGRIPSPYNSRQPGQPPPMPPHFAAVRSGTPPMRMRVPGPTQLYHTPHHPMDPSPSGGGPISITSRDRASPLGPGPAMIPPAAGSPLAKSGPTPPPYVRGGPPLSRFADNPQLGSRHQLPPFTSASPANHSLQQPSPPPNRPPGNFSPYHPQPPPNYHYGAYPPPAPMPTADDAVAYQGSPYSAEHFSTPAENPPPIQAPPPQTSQPQAPAPPPPPPSAQQHSTPHQNEPVHGPGKQYDEEGTGEFGGLVSYFSSQREDDLDS